jgi:hypothetical protein
LDSIRRKPRTKINVS